MAGIEDMMEALVRSRGEIPTERISPPDILIGTLREYLADYTAERCRFNVGDIVTPKKSGLMGEYHGRPFVVAEVFDPPIRMTGRTDKLTHANWGAKIDVRVLHEQHGHILAHPAESWIFEPFVATTTTDGKAN